MPLLASIPLATLPGLHLTFAQPLIVKREIADGFGFVVKHPILRNVVCSISTFNFFGSMIGGLAAGRLSNRIGSARIIWVLGSSSAFRPSRCRWRRRAGACCCSWAAPSSCSGFVFNVAQVTCRQSITPPELLGRVNHLGLDAGRRGRRRHAGHGGGVRETLRVSVIGCWCAGL
ncbi:hypothetical protein [Streptomyces sp. NPDC001816]|uniref:hypothetical protein n=1 Tax=Streptomyces sp. NPDC001816 TaxID=3364612 RepID=UPI003684154C